MRPIAPILSVLVLSVLSTPAMADPWPSSIPIPDDFQPEGIAVGEGNTFYVGSLRDGRLADVILWKPGFFGVKPEWVFKGGFPAWGPLGEGNATVERAEPTRYRADWAGVPTAAPKVSVTFVSAALSGQQIGGLRMRLGTRRTLLPVGGVRGLTRASLLANRAVPPVEIDVRSGAVSLGGTGLAVDPVAEVPLSRRYLLR